MYYFAYGSNMPTERFRDRVPSCKFITVAVLKSHILRFHKRSRKDGSGKCNAYYTGTESDEVIGVVFDIEPTERAALDIVEGLGRGYHEKTVCVETTDGVIRAFMYEADNTAIDDALKPFTWYKKLVVQGAREHGLPEDYIQQIEAVPADGDPGGETNYETD